MKPYAETIIAAIRAADPENLILVSSPHWAHDVDDATGNGRVDLAETEAWMDLMHKWQLSHCNWAVSDKRERPQF